MTKKSFSALTRLTVNQINYRLRLFRSCGGSNASSQLSSGAKEVDRVLRSHLKQENMHYAL